MSKVIGLTVRSTTLDGAWARLFTHLSENGSSELAPLRLSIRPQNGLVGCSTELATSIDACLERMGLAPTATVANTIFPSSRLLLADGDRHRMFSQYLDDYDWIKAQDRSNRAGTYFGRMIEPRRDRPEGQLEYAISTFVKNRAIQRGPTAIRLQVGVYDADRDNRGARPSFPCLQQLSFVPKGGVLRVNGFYATQKVMAKGYGNYMGLLRLGSFVAEEMGLELVALDLHIGLAHMGEAGSILKGSDYAILREVARKIASLDDGGGCVED